SVNELLEVERSAGLQTMASYEAFSERARSTKRRLLTFLLHAKDDGRTIAAYGAPAKGNTLLNYCGIGSDIIDYTVDRSPHKQGKFLPGSRIPIFHPDKILETKPDYVFVLPWNLKDEIMQQMSHIGDWGGRFVVPIPDVQVVEPPTRTA